MFTSVPKRDSLIKLSQNGVETLFLLQESRRLLYLCFDTRSYRVVEITSWTPESQSWHDFQVVGSRWKEECGRKNYKFFREGYVYDVYTAARDPHSFVKARCYRSLRKNEEPHYLIIRFESDVRAVVSNAHCSCKRWSLQPCVRIDFPAERLRLPERSGYSERRYLYQSPTILIHSQSNTNCNVPIKSTRIQTREMSE